MYYLIHAHLYNLDIIIYDLPNISDITFSQNVIIKELLIFLVFPYLIFKSNRVDNSLEFEVK